MPFIGNQPADKFLTLEKQVFTTSATDTYTLDREVSSVNDLELFLNNVRQEPTEAYTISGTTLTLASAITASDSLYCVYQGRAVGTQSPATGSVTNDMLAGSIATSKLADGSTFATTNGITEADQWRLYSNFAGDASPISSNLERNDNAFNKIGTGMTHSSGVWTFPSTGIWYVSQHYTFDEEATSGSDATVLGRMEVSTDGGSSYTFCTSAWGSLDQSNDHITVGSDTFIDCTDTSLVKIRFSVASQLTNNRTLGNSDENYTWFTFIRLGDT
jgi:hypothetical protein